MSANNFNLLTNEYDEMNVPAPSGGVVAGDMRKVGSVVGIFPVIAAEGVTVALIYKTEKIIVPKSAGGGFIVGGKVYFDAAAKSVTGVDAGNTLCGRSREIAANDATTLEIVLNGDVEA